MVVQDDLDLDPGTLRIRRGGSAAGHKGIADIISCLGDDDFVRVRVGIGHPRRSFPDSPMPEEGQVTAWVLGAARGEEASLIEEAEARAVDAVQVIIVQGLERAQQEFNRS